MLKPMLARGELHCIGATTLTSIGNIWRKDAALEAFSADHRGRAVC